MSTSESPCSEACARRSSSVAVAILNFRNFADTIACIESVLCVDWPQLHVYVVDNASGNGSTEEIGTFLARSESARGRVSLYESPRNDGFASGNNIAIRQAMDDGFDYVWVLNNDTIVESDSVACFLRAAARYQSSGRKVGPIGAKIVDYGREGTIQGVGGSYNVITGRVHHIGGGQLDRGQFDDPALAEELDYPLGVSMFVSRHFIEEVGLLSEDYFLYFEEIDWCRRARRLGWSIGYCPDVRVMHKQGASIGSNTDATLRSELSDVAGMKSRFTFIRKHHPWTLPFAFASLAVVVANRIRRGQGARIFAMLAAAWNGLRYVR